MMEANRHRLQARKSGAGRVGPMGAVGDEHLVPALASTSMVSLNDAQSGPFAVGARRRLQAHPVHPGQRQQGTLQLPHQPQGALRIPGRVIWVQIGEVVEPGDGLVDRRVELHECLSCKEEPCQAAFGWFSRGFGEMARWGCVRLTQNA